MKNSDWDICDPTSTKDDAGDYPERQLWCAVVDLAVFEARRGGFRALHWFTEPDFAICAKFLGLNIGRVRRTLESNAIVGKKKRNMMARGN